MIDLLADSVPWDGAELTPRPGGMQWAKERLNAGYRITIVKWDWRPEVVGRVFRVVSGSVQVSYDNGLTWDWASTFECFGTGYREDEIEWDCL